MVTIYDGRTDAVTVASNVAVVLVPAVADTTLEDITLAEYNAGTAIECSIREFSLTGTVQNRQEQFLCDADASEWGGPVTWTIDPVVIQAGDPQDANTLLDGLTKGEIRYIVQRLGLAHDTAAAAGQKVRIAKVEVSLVEDMPMVATPDGTKFEARLHFAVREFQRNAAIVSGT